jgi:diaminohydroxyphosphoribosylaminopyrimidine deaminase/5-amino-6-(5-phosphoribosylamino)uracil reductase
MHLSLPKVTPTPAAALDESHAWSLIQALAARARAGAAVAHPSGVRFDASGALTQVALGRGLLDILPDHDPMFRSKWPLPSSVEHMLALYLPLCVGAGADHVVVGHIGQSLDGQIATSTGASRFITGHQDLMHTHRLRALFDAVLVGASTVVCDDPRLTTRLVPGPNPIRVVVDPNLRTPEVCHVLCDGAAPSLLLCAQGTAHADHRGSAQIVEVQASGATLAPREILRELGLRGLRRIFIEGGGVTISHFLQAGLLDRLHIAVSPVFLGQGRPGLSLPRIDSLDEALRPRVTRFTLGEDVLFDCDLANAGA